MPSNHRIYLAASVLLLVLGALSACPHRRSEPAVSTHSAAPDRSVTLSGKSRSFVRSEPAKPARDEDTRSLVGRVSYDERHVARLGPPVQGRVSKVNVVTGDAVTPGMVLLTLSAPEIAGVQAQVSQARTARTLAERNATRAKLLVSEGAGSEAEAQQAQAALSQAKLEEERAVAALAAIGGAHGATGYQLRSPIAGNVVERNVSVGSEVHADQDAPLVTVADLSTVWVVADVYEQDLARVRVGDKARVHVLAVPGRVFEGTITYLSDNVDPQTRAVSARVELDNADRMLRIGMYARVEVHGRGGGAAEVPTSALLSRRDQFYVFVAQGGGGKFVQREVRPGEQHGQHTTIVSGLTPGELVVTEGAILLDAEANEAL
jgi:cobalt-zinc-cadmium efflux system membrane fusion protein